MTAKERKEFKEGLAMTKEVCVIALLIMAFISSCNSRKDAAAIIGNVANLRHVVEEVKQDMNQQYLNERYEQ